MESLKYFEKVLDGQNLTFEDWLHVAAMMLNGQLTEHQIAAILGSLRTRGLNADVLSAMTTAVLGHTQVKTLSSFVVVDCCGTGGDGAGLINISTATAFVAASLGLHVAKHGNRGVSSGCGSSDVLSALDVPTATNLDDAVIRLKNHGLAFLHAPDFHPVLRSIAPVRKSLGTRTVFNVLGPLLNPLRPKYQLIGVYSKALLQPVAQALKQQGVRRALVVYGAGMDELNPMTNNDACLLDCGQIQTLTIKPRELGIQVDSLNSLIGGDAHYNAKIIQELFQGNGTQEQRAMVAMNAGALLWLSGYMPDLHQAVQCVLEVLETDAVFHKLRQVQEALTGASTT